jgi:hypothetical protein
MKLDPTTKTRPFLHPIAATSVTRVGPGLVMVESQETPEDARDLLAAWPSITAALPPQARRSTVVCVRNDDGELLATVAVCEAEASPLATQLAAAALEKTRYLADLAWSDGAHHYAPLALYLAVRRARIDGATTIAAHVKDAAGAFEAALGMAPLGVPSAGGREARAQRVDLAADHAYRAAVDACGIVIDPQIFGHEVTETFERWLHDLYGRGFFRAVADRSLAKEQYVHAISNMHQFVRWTTRLLGHAVAQSHERGLRNHFLGHLQGEINHEVIIERDLAHLGQDVSYVTDRMAPSPATRQFMSVQESLVGFHNDPLLFLASPLAAEGIASHLTPQFLKDLEQTIASWGVAEPARAMVFFKSHVATDGGDDGHWEMVMKVVRESLCSDQDVRRFLGVLQASMRSLTLAYDEYVDDVSVFASGTVDCDEHAIAAE